MIKYVASIIFLIMANVLDVIYTRDLMLSGKATEANPMMDWVISNYGFIGLGAVKLFFISVVAYLLYYMFTRTGGITKFIARFYWMAVVIYGILLGYHYLLKGLS